MIWDLFEVITTLALIYGINKKLISSYRVAKYAIILILPAAIFSIFKFDYLSDKIMEIVLIFFSVSLIFQFIYYIKYQNNKKQSESNI